MNINFPLVLMCLVFAGALIWLLDALWWRKSRAEGVQDPWWVENAKSLTPVLALVFFIRSFLYEPFQIPSASMEKTLLIGDFILVNKYTYGIRLPVWRNKVFDINQPERGDVMVVVPPHKDQYYIKRVIGLPGDRIQYRDKVLTINGVEQRQRPIGSEKRSLYRRKIERLGELDHEIQHNISSARRDGFSVEVPPGHYFMMGDNRDNSADSRLWGTVPESRIVGQAVAIWMHKEPGWHWPTFSRAGGFE